MYLLKYILLIVIIYVFLTYISKSKMKNEKILQIIIIAIVGMWVLNNTLWKGRGASRHTIFKKIEKMNGKIEIPTYYRLDDKIDDRANTGIDFNYYDDPRNPLLQHGQFEKQLMPYNDVLLEMEQQRYGTDNIGIPYGRVAEQADIPSGRVAEQAGIPVSNKPGYYLSLNGEYSKSGVSYEYVDDLIRKSKLHDLKHQHNFNIPCSPHTHIGKARGRLNWTRAVKN